MKPDHPHQIWNQKSPTEDRKGGNYKKEVLKEVRMSDVQRERDLFCQRWRLAGVLSRAHQKIPGEGQKTKIGGGVCKWGGKRYDPPLAPMPSVTEQGRANKAGSIIKKNQIWIKRDLICLSDSTHHSLAVNFRVSILLPLFPVRCCRMSHATCIKAILAFLINPQTCLSFIRSRRAMLVEDSTRWRLLRAANMKRSGQVKKKNKKLTRIKPIIHVISTRGRGRSLAALESLIKIQSSGLQVLLHVMCLFCRYKILICLHKLLAWSSTDAKPKTALYCSSLMTVRRRTVLCTGQ